jgi:competence protein ComGC
MSALLKELWLFLRETKAWWLAPILVILVLLSILIFVTEGSAVLPFIYTLF